MRLVTWLQAAACLWLPLLLWGDNAREIAGRQAKLAGHRFEERVAVVLGERSGARFATTGAVTKADVVCPERGLRISLKNPSRGHTQVALLGQETLGEYLALDEAGQQFVRLFFGLADGDALAESEVAGYGVAFADLSQTAEIRRNRLLFGSVPAPMRQSFMRALNETHKRAFLQALVVGDANVLGWASRKDDPKSVRYYRMQDVLARLLTAEWQPSKSGSTLHFVVDGKKYMHMQMKGSSKRFSAGYHSAMIHLYDELFADLDTIDPGLRSGRLPTLVPKGADPAAVAAVEAGFNDVLDRTTFAEFAAEREEDTAVMARFRLFGHGDKNRQSEFPTHRE